jgi:prepilin signal peptidase PulO-like enzyme (type II secretory pathway)
MGLMGRCKNCKTKISIQYPIVEFVTGVIFAMLFLKFSSIGGGDMLSWLTPTFAIIYAYYATMFSLLMVIVAYDMKHKIIPDMLSMIFGVLAFIGIFFLSSNSFLGSPVLLWHTPSLVELFSGVLLALPFASLWLVSRGRWIGLGDAKLALGLGWFLGLSMGFSAIIIAFWSGALIGTTLILFKKGYGMKSEIPFALYLVFGTLLVFFLQINLFPL